MVPSSWLPVTLCLLTLPMRYVHTYVCMLVDTKHYICISTYVRYVCMCRHMYILMYVVYICKCIVLLEDEAGLKVLFYRRHSILRSIECLWLYVSMYVFLYIHTCTYIQCP